MFPQVLVMTQNGSDFEMKNISWCVCENLKSGWVMRGSDAAGSSVLDVVKVICLGRWSWFNRKWAWCALLSQSFVTSWFCHFEWHQIAGNEINKVLIDYFWLSSKRLRSPGLQYAKAFLKVMPLFFFFFSVIIDLQYAAQRRRQSRKGEANGERR